MAFNFPSSPAIGDTANGYEWDGTAWIVIGSDGAGGGSASYANVLDFGARGDGVTNDTLAMQAAHDTGRVVFYPRGTYAFTTITMEKGGIIGEGMGLTSLITGTTGAEDVIVVTGAAAIVSDKPPLFANFLLQTSAVKSGGAGIKFAPPSGESAYATIREVEIVNVPIGIHFAAANNWLVTGCKIMLFKTYGILVDNTNHDDSGDGSITNCLINTAAATAVGIRQLSSGGLKIVGNKILGGGIGYSLEFNGTINTGDLLIVGNSIEQCAQQSIVLSRVSGSAAFGQIVITGNQFALATMHIAASAPIYDLTITGNTFAVGSGGFGVYIDGVDNYVVSGNSFRGQPSNTAVFHTNSNNGLIIGNQIVGFTTNVTPGSAGVRVANNPTTTGPQTVSDTTASTSKTTGALVVGGGIGAGGQVTADSVVATLGVTAKNFASTLGSGTGLGGHLDVSAQTALTVANGTSGTMFTVGAQGYFFVYSSISDMALYSVFNATITLAHSSLGVFVAPTTTPAAGKFCPAFDGVNAVKMYNNQGGSVNFKFAFIRLA